MTNIIQVLSIASLMILLSACSSKSQKNTVSISTASVGVAKNSQIHFPLVLVDRIENKSLHLEKLGEDVLVIHTGHFLKATASKDENVKILNQIIEAKIDYVNLAIEDFIIADQLGIDLEAYNIKFLNSSVVNLNEDNIIEKTNIKPFYFHDDVTIMGLSDKNIDKLLSLDKYIVSDHVLALIRARKLASKQQTSPSNIVIIHTMLPAEINEVMDRLPPNFINSLAD
jgi:hypothetical protein